ncbi:MAG TPA: hypothetical protein VFO25_08450 [Candidatus Eremiobacteraceae bacterium]|nr:hypothetical protein [Candidatus Eremiobacteraceae bacterium]
MSSYAPLMIVFAIRNPFGSEKAQFVLVALAVLSVGALVLFLNLARGLSPTPIKVSEIRSFGSETMSYVVTYFIPFFGISYANPNDIISLSLVYAVVLVIYVSENLIHINPVLALLGYHLFEITGDEGKPSTLITRRTYFRIGEDIRAVPLSDYIIMEKA